MSDNPETDFLALPATHIVSGAPFMCQPATSSECGVGSEVYWTSSRDLSSTPAPPRIRVL